MSSHWFSNFKEMSKPMIYQGIQFWTVENFFQAMKTNDLERRKMMAALTPRAAKQLGLKVELRPGWDTLRFEVMMYALRYKFSLEVERAQLLATQDEPIIETNTWHDTFWGVCDCPKHKGFGWNHLGKMLMQIRQELRHG